MNKEVLDALNKLIAVHPKVESAFYAVSMYEHTIKLQGYANAETLSILKDLKLSPTLNPEHLWFDVDTYIDGIKFAFCLTAIEG